MAFYKVKSLARVCMIITHPGMGKKNNLITFIKAMYLLNKINPFTFKPVYKDQYGEVVFRDRWPLFTGKFVL